MNSLRFHDFLYSQPLQNGHHISRPNGLYMTLLLKTLGLLMAINRLKHHFEQVTVGHITIGKREVYLRFMMIFVFRFSKRILTGDVTSWIQTRHRFWSVKMLHLHILIVVFLVSRINIDSVFSMLLLRKDKLYQVKMLGCLISDICLSDR